MDEDGIILALAALAQPTRLQTFKILVAAAPDPVPAGAIARRLAVPHNTLSAHLGVLSRAGLVSVERQSRSMLYRAEVGRLRAVLDFLLVDCCGGHPELCAPPVHPRSCCAETEAADA